MLFFSRWKAMFILGLVALGLLLASPNVLGGARDNLPNFAQRTINLGLDLQGGAHMLLAVDLENVIENELKSREGAIRQVLREQGRIAADNIDIRDGAITGRFRNPDDFEAGFAALRSLITQVQVGSFGQTAPSLDIEDLGEGRFRVEVTPERIEEIRARTIDQSIEVLRRRIDPAGNTEMTLAREGDERILLQVPGAKNVDEIKERINTSANLSFHLVDPRSSDTAFLQRAVETGTMEDGTFDVDEAQTPPGTVYFPGDQGTGSPGLLVVERTRITGECLANAKEGLHPQGNPGAVVNFTFDTRCAREFGKLTSQNVGKPFAIVLDERVISAPNIRVPILQGSGYIEFGSGSTLAEAKELSVLLNAGALPAKLNVVEERTVSATLGQDSIDAGRIASILGLSLVGVFMFIFYGMRFGVIAIVALATNVILIVGLLSLFGSTLTLPGIAGIILTMGMAVDANVLIFERIREERHNGRSPINSIETGYRQSIEPILDANITTMIAAVTLYFVGSGPVRGFAVTLAVGIVTSVFTAVVFARLLTATWLRRSRPTALPI